MNSSDILEKLDERNDPDNFSYETLIARLQTIKGIVSPHITSVSMTQDEVCTAVSCAFADFDTSALSSQQLLRIAITIQSFWRLYPVNVHGMTRKQILDLYVAGDYEEVVNLSMGYDTSTSPPKTPVECNPLKKKPISTPHTTPFEKGKPADHDILPSQLSSSIASLARYYTEDRKYAGLDHESLARARTHFRSTCSKFGIPPEYRKHCLDLVVKQSVHNLPQLVQDNMHKGEDEIWTLIEQRIYTTDRLNRIRSEWQTVNLTTFAPKANEPPLSTFERLVQRLSLLQSQLPSIYNNEQALIDKLRDTIAGQPWEQSVIAQKHTDPSQLIESIKYALHTSQRSQSNQGNPSVNTSRGLSTNIPSQSFLTSQDEPPSDPHEYYEDDDVELDISQSIDENEPNTVYFVLRKYSRNNNRPPRTMRFRKRSPKRPSAEHPCAICGATDHWAKEHFKDNHTANGFKLKPNRQPSHFTSDNDDTLESDGIPIPTFSSPPTGLPPNLASVLASIPNNPNPPTQSSNFTTNGQKSFFITTTPQIEEVRTVFHTSKTLSASPYPIIDSGTFSDLMSATWVNENKPHIVSDLKPSRTAFKFGNDKPPTIGRVGVELHLQDTNGKPFTITMPEVNIIAESTVPLLIGYKTQGDHDILTRPSNNTLIVLPKDQTQQPLIIHGQQIDGHLCVVTQTPEQQSWFSKQELKLIHRQFGHKQVSEVLKAFPHGTFSAMDIKFLNEIAASCRPCQEYAHLPRRPRFNTPNSPLYFNRLICADVFDIPDQSSSVLDITCNDTDFGQGTFILNKTAELIFAVLYVKWFTVYGLPETVIGDRGGEFENKLLIEAHASLGVVYRFAPTEAPWSIGRVERHHAPIRRAFQMVMSETPKLSPELALALAYKARNDTPRAHGKSPHEAVFGETPRLLVGDNKHSTHEIAIRHQAMQTARASMEAFIAKDRLSKALNHPSHHVPYVTVGQPVVFHRKNSPSWFHGIVHALDGSTIYVAKDGKIFSAHETRVKPYVTPPSLRQATPNTPIPSKTPAPNPPPELNPYVQVFLANQTKQKGSPLLSEYNPRHPRWDDPKLTEINYFRNMNAMDSVHINTVPQNKFVFPYTWFCTESNDRGNAKPPLRARYCLQGQLDADKANNVATAPVASHRAIRTSLCIAAILNWHIRTEDFKRAYLQADPLQEPIYAMIPPEAGEPEDHVWAFKVPVYGKDDAGRKFFFTVHNTILRTIPNIRQSTSFDAVYVVPQQGIITTYSDDTKAAGTKEFLNNVSKFTSRFKTHRSDIDKIKFAGMNASVINNGITIEMHKYISGLSSISESCTLDELKHLVAQLLWVGRTARPDILCDSTKFMGIKTVNPDSTRQVNRILEYTKSNPLQLVFQTLNPDNLQLHVYTDFSGSAQTPPRNQQVGYIILLGDSTKKVTPIHWNSHKPKRVCRGPGAGELVALADGINAAIDIHTLLQETMSRRIPISAYTDASSVHDVCSSFHEPSDLQGKTDVHFIRQLLLRNQLAELNRIDGQDNPADALTKPLFGKTKPNNHLASLLQLQKLDIAVRKCTTSETTRKTPRDNLRFKT